MARIKYTNALGIDVGEKRIGIARVNAIAKLPEPIVTLTNSSQFTNLLDELIGEHNIDILVVGLPRNLNGQETKQSEYVRRFVKEQIQPVSAVPIVFQDETLSTVAATASSTKSMIGKFGIDSLAAVEILSDFIKDNG